MFCHSVLSANMLFDVALKPHCEICQIYLAACHRVKEEIIIFVSHF